jgi:truncated hemoglobin YjbI
MKVAAQSLYRPDGKAVLRELVEYFYDFMASLTCLGPVRENPVIDLTNFRKVKYGLLKS